MGSIIYKILLTWLAGTNHCCLHAETGCMLFHKQLCQPACGTFVHNMPFR
jgi:hypothetical protein